MFGSFGTSPHGGDLLKWPARMVDAFIILQQELNKVDELARLSDLPPKRGK